MRPLPFLPLLVSVSGFVLADDFIRGDCNGDQSTNLADAIQVLGHLFESVPIDCSDACDGNDDGLIDIADGIYTLSYLFSMGPAPAVPFPECGADPTADTLTCDSYSGCATGGLSHAIDIQPIWNDECVSCHAPGGVGVTFGSLDLSGDAYDQIVDVPSTQSPLLLIAPGSPADSYLWNKLNDTQDSVGGSGQGMPIGPSLDPAVLALIEQWILEGANP